MSLLPEYISNPHLNSDPSTFRSWKVHKAFSEAKPLEWHASLPGYEPAPLVSLPDVAAKLNLDQVWCKDESGRFGIKAFKALGASWAIHRWLQRNPGTQKPVTFCTATDGNHGKSVAWSAKMMGQRAEVFMPGNTVPARIERIRDEGATVHVIDGNYEATVAAAKRAAENNGYVLVQDTSWPGYESIPTDVKAGYLTHFEELESQPDKPLHGSEKLRPDLVMLQSGVGSWAAAAVWYYHKKYGKNRPKLVVVEPVTSDGFAASLIAGKPEIPRNAGETIMAGLNCGRPSLLAWEVLREGADGVITVTDESAKEAMRIFAKSGKRKAIVSGESGASGLAGLLTMKNLPDGEKPEWLREVRSALVFNTEGDTDPEGYREIIGELEKMMGIGKNKET